MGRVVPAHVEEVVASGRRHGVEPGAALILDVEGSTALAARLQTQGTEGAEALAELLGRVFDPIVGRVAANGGFVAHFTGDGAIAVFHGPVDTASAAAVAAGRAVLDDVGALGPLDSPVGPVTLGVRAAVGAGSVEVDIAATDGVAADAQNAVHSFSGSAIEEALRIEPEVAAGRLGIGPTAEAGLRARQTEPAPEQADRRVGQAPDRSLRFAPDGLDRTRRGEFRPVVSLFARLDITALDIAALDVPDPDTPAGGGAGAAVARLLEVVADHHGHLVKVARQSAGASGPTALVVWGAPSSHRLDLARSLRFAEAVAGGALGVGVSVGITRATLYAGWVGGSGHEAYTVVGAAAHLGARLCAAAASGEIRADAAIAENLPPGWWPEPLEADYRGFAPGVGSHRLRAVGPTGDLLPADVTGRDGEIDQLTAALRSGVEGQTAQIVVVHGTAGIGKSTVIAAAFDRLAATAEPFTLVEAAVDRTVGAFGLFRPIVRRLLGDAGSGATPTDRASVRTLVAGLPGVEQAEVERIAAALDDLLGLGGGQDVTAVLAPADRFANLAFALGDLLIAVASERPIVVAARVEGLDRSAIDLLGELRSRLDAAGVAFVFELQQPVGLLGVDAALEIGGLDRSSIATLLESSTGEPPSAEHCDAVLQRTAGNPLFVDALIAWMQRHGGSVDDVPEQLRSVLVAHLDELEVRARRTVQAAAVLGIEFDLHDLAALFPDRHPDDVAIDCKDAVGAGVLLVAAPDRYRFRSALLRDVAYDMQLHAELRPLHRSAASIVRDRPDRERRPLEVADHLERGGDPGGALPWLVTAADTEAGRYAVFEALEILERAVAIVDSLDRNESEEAEVEHAAPAIDRFDLLRRQADVLSHLADGPAQEAILDRLDALAPPGSARAVEVGLRRGGLARRRGAYDTAEPHLRQALTGVDDIVDANGPHLADLRTDLLVELALVARDRGRADDAQSYARQAIDTAGDIGRVARCTDLLGTLAWDVGDFATSADQHRRAADAAKEAGDVYGEIQYLNNLGTALFGLGDHSAAGEIHRRALERAREFNLVDPQHNNLDNWGGAAWALGRYELAIERYTEALAIRRRIGDEVGVAISLGNIGGALRALGRFDEAEAHYAEAFAIDRRIGRRRGEGFDLHGLGVVELDRGRWAEAERWLGAAVELRREVGETHLATESRIAWAAAVAGQGRVDEALVEVRAVLEEEADPPFSHAVEPAACAVQAIGVLEPVDPERAERVRSSVAAWVLQSADRIADPDDRRSFLTAVRAHRELIDPAT